MVKKPKLVMADRLCNTVESRTLSEVQDLIILNILSSLKALSTDSPELLSLAYKSSNILSKTIMQSKTLKPSFMYFLTPSPNSLRTISEKKMRVNTKFAISLTCEIVGSYW